MATSDPRHEYVRFYLTVLDDLERVIAGLAGAHAASRESLRAFEDTLRDVPGAPTLAPAAALSTAALWRPRDAANLTGLTDVYEVIGRFSFQGEDDANLTALAALVRALRAEVDRQRASLAELSRVPTLAHEHASRLEEKELATSRAQQAELLKQFEPAATQLREIAEKLLGALRAEKKPDLARIETAEAAYQDYVTRVRGLYGKALPFLRAQLTELCKLAGADTPQSWPDTLPFAPTLPAEFVTPPVQETPALAQARQTAEQWAAQEAALARAQDELGVQLRRADGEMNALVQREAEALKEINVAKVVVRWAAKHVEIDAVRQGYAAVMSEGQSRTTAHTQLGAEVQRAMNAIAALQRDATEWAQAIAAKDEKIAELKKGEPAIFGKDDWRAKVNEAQADLDDMRTELTRRQQQIAAAQGEVERLRARERAEHATIATLTRQHEELKARETTLQQEMTRIEQELGPARPASRVSVEQAEAVLGAIQTARNETRARIERLASEVRRIREDIDRAAVQAKQLQAERERNAASLRAAHQHSTTAYEDALRTLAVRRQAAFDSHAQQVLSGLEDSLTQVDRVFIDPARRALLIRAGVMSGAPGQVRDRAAAFGRALTEVTRRAEEVFDAQLAVIGRIEQEFLGKLAEALPRAWHDV